MIGVLASAPSYDNWALVIGGYAIVLVPLSVYAVRIIRRGRKLADQVPDEDKTWT